MSLRELLTVFPPDRLDVPVTAKKVDFVLDENALPTHQHAVGQLLLTLRGSAACRVFGDLWLIPPQCAVWVPPHTPHCNRITARSSVCLLLIRQERIQLPSTCCTLSITPLVRELVQRVAAFAPEAAPTDHSERLIQVLLTELSHMPVTGLRLPVSSDARLQSIAENIIDAPAERKDLSGWAGHIGMSRRSLARLVVRETGLSFGRWRQQLLLVMAIQKLSDGASVQQTAWDLGYESVTAFITMFKKALGTSPARYVRKDAAEQRPGAT